MKAISMSVLLIAIIATAAVTYYFVTSPTGGEGLPGAVYSGRVKINLVQNKRIDGSAYAVDTTQMRMLHGSMEYNDKVGDFSSYSITGDLNAQDKGYWYLIIDYGTTNNTLWLDQAETRKSTYVSRIFGRDGDKDGFDEEYVELYLGDLQPKQAGESYKEIELTLVYDPARTSSIAWTSLTNETDISTTAYAYEFVSGYTTGFTEGDLAKLSKVTIATSDSGNTTYPDLEYFKLVHLKLGPYTWTASDFGAYDLANTRWKMEFGDQVNSQGGLDLYDPKNAGALWASYELKAYCKFPTANKTLRVHMLFYFYKPDGSVTSNFERIVDFVTP